MRDSNPTPPKTLLVSQDSASYIKNLLPTMRDSTLFILIQAVSRRQYRKDSRSELSLVQSNRTSIRSSVRLLVDNFKFI